MSPSDTPQHGNDTSRRFTRDKLHLLTAGLSLISLFVLLPIFQFLNFSPYFHFRFGMDLTLFILIVLCFGLVPTACLLAFVKFAIGKSREALYIKLILGVSLFLFISHLYSITLDGMALAIKSSILLIVVAVGIPAILKSSKIIVWGLAWLSILIIPATFFHGYKQFLTIPKQTMESKAQPSTAEIDRHNIYMIFLDGCEMTSAYLDEDSFPREDILPNLRKFLIEDANWFPNALTNAPVTYLSFPTMITGKLFVSKVNNYLVDERNIFSILNSRYKVHTFLHRYTSTSFCMDNPQSCSSASTLAYYQPMKILFEVYGFISTFKISRISFPIGRFHANTYRRSVFVDHFLEMAETDPDKGNFYIIQLFDREKPEIKEFDKFMGDFLDTLKKTGKYEDAIIVVMSDHGFVRDPSIVYGVPAKQIWPLYKVPFAIKTPGTGEGKLYQYKAQNIDIVPTLLARVLPAEEYSDLQLDGVDVLKNRPIREHYINFDKEDVMYRLDDSLGGEPKVIEVPLNQIRRTKN